ncbi:hypothetical protein PR048_004880 [Dryococelus australis]|uniref:Uncharacterized protein n=1 Tax=Dryococelus australis TaxID=614101 RepID=A0ABQ9I7S3_9NEOP|nr:hypothetical protein PR048_004880 [Dryococelus australis]
MISIARGRSGVFNAGTRCSRGQFSYFEGASFYREISSTLFESPMYAPKAHSDSNPQVGASQAPHWSPPLPANKGRSDDTGVAAPGCHEGIGSGLEGWVGPPVLAGFERRRDQQLAAVGRTSSACHPRNPLQSISSQLLPHLRQIRGARGDEPHILERLCSGRQTGRQASLLTPPPPPQRELREEIARHGQRCTFIRRGTPALHSALFAQPRGNDTPTSPLERVPYREVQLSQRCRTGVGGCVCVREWELERVIIVKLGRSPPTKANWVRFRPTSLPNFFAGGNRAGRCNWSAGFLDDLPFPPPFHYGAAQYSTRFTLIGCQDPVVKSCSNLYSTPNFRATRPPAASFGTIPKCDNARVTRPRREPGSPWWEASRLTAQPLRPRLRRDGPRPVSPAVGVRTSLYCEVANNARRWRQASDATRRATTRRSIVKTTLEYRATKCCFLKWLTFFTAAAVSCFTTPFVTVQQFNKTTPLESRRATSCGYNSSHHVWHALNECLQDINGDSSPFLLQPLHELRNGFWPRLTSPHPAIRLVPKMLYIGLRSGFWVGQSNRRTLLSAYHCIVALETCDLALSS